MIKICESIRDISPVIRSYILLKFLTQIRKLGWIFFYNGRKDERKKVLKEHEYEDLEGEIGVLITNIHLWLRR
jgi:hypothetical protein